MKLSCERPYMVAGRYPVPCERCTPCWVKRKARWATKLELELLATWDASGRLSSFVTDTYDAEHLPPGGSLRKRDFQLRMKRLRVAVARAGHPAFRVAYCGEYGTRLGRPHYHSLLFGLDPWEWADMIKATWGLGGTDVKQAEPGRCRYMTQDMVKSLAADDLRECPFIEGPRGRAGGLGAAFARKVGQAAIASPAVRKRVHEAGDVPSQVRIGGRTVQFDRTLKRHARVGAELDAVSCSERAAAEFYRRCDEASAVVGRAAWGSGLVQTDEQRNLQRAKRRAIFRKAGTL